MLRFWYYVNFFTNTSKTLSWKSIGLLKESIENITTSNSNFDPTLFNYYPLPDIKFNRNWLINNNDLSLDAVNLLWTKSVLERFRYRLYIRKLLKWFANW